MRIHNEIELQAPADELFEFLSDVERVGPCLPGATIDGKEGEDYAGRMEVKVGPINAAYQGRLRFVEHDKEARRAVMRARAEEVNGQGNAEASITTEVEPSGDGSIVRMDTDLQMRGKVAQFGRGAMEKISQRMFEEFARNIEQQFNGDGAAPAAAGETEAERPSAEDGDARAEVKAESGGGGGAPAPRPDRKEPEDQGLDVLSTFGGTALAKAGPVLAGVVLAFGYGILVGRLRESRATVQRMARLL